MLQHLGNENQGKSFIDFLLKSMKKDLYIWRPQAKLQITEVKTGNWSVQFFALTEKFRK